MEKEINFNELGKKIIAFAKKGYKKESEDYFSDYRHEITEWENSVGSIVAKYREVDQIDNSFFLTNNSAGLSKEAILKIDGIGEVKLYKKIIGFDGGFYCKCGKSSGIKDAAKNPVNKTRIDKMVTEIDNAIK